MKQDPFLQVRDLSLRFGGVIALDGVSFDVEAGQICGLIGPNGAGKTTLFNCLSRIYTPSGGEIVLGGTRLLGVAASDVARLGIGRTFQHLALFSSLTVRDNVRTGLHSALQGGFVADALRLPFVRREERRLDKEVEDLLAFFDLSGIADSHVGILPFGLRKRVEFARALAMRPRILLLDEPAGGLNHLEVDRLCDLVWRVRDRFSVTILLVEHHMNFVMRVSERLIALDFGRKIAEGSPAEIQGNADVVRAYLGTAA